MIDVVFVAGAYLVALGALGAYAAVLVRRLRLARLARTCIDRSRAAAVIEAAAQPQTR